jgi:hypothetical protein
MTWLRGFGGIRVLHSCCLVDERSQDIKDVDGTAIRSAILSRVMIVLFVWDPTGDE